MRLSAIIAYIFLFILINSCSGARYRNLTIKRSYTPVKSEEKLKASHNNEFDLKANFKAKGYDLVIKQKYHRLDFPIVTSKTKNKSTIDSAPTTVKNILIDQVILKPTIIRRTIEKKIPAGIDGEGIIMFFLVIIALVLTVLVLRVWYITWGCIMSVLWPVIVFCFILGILWLFYLLLSGNMPN